LIQVIVLIVDLDDGHAGFLELKSPASWLETGPGVLYPRCFEGQGPGR
jgi:hypothetical protein